MLAPIKRALSVDTAQTRLRMISAGTGESNRSSLRLHAAGSTAFFAGAARFSARRDRACGRGWRRVAAYVAKPMGAPCLRQTPHHVRVSMAHRDRVGRGTSTPSVAPKGPSARSLRMNHRPIPRPSGLVRSPASSTFQRGRAAASIGNGRTGGGDEMQIEAHRSSAPVRRLPLGAVYCHVPKA